MHAACPVWHVGLVPGTCTYADCPRAYTEGPAWAQNAPQTSPGARNERQAGLGSSEREQMNQTRNGKTKPRKALKTTRLCELPAAAQGAPQTQRGGILNRAGIFRPFPAVSFGCRPRRGSFTPPPAASDVGLAREIPSVFNLDPRSHALRVPPPRSPRCARPAEAPLTLFFLFFSYKCTWPPLPPGPSSRRCPIPAQRNPDGRCFPAPSGRKTAKYPSVTKKKKKRLGLGRKKKKEGGKECCCCCCEFRVWGFCSVLTPRDDRGGQAAFCSCAQSGAPRWDRSAVRAGRTQRCCATSDWNRIVPGRESVLLADGRAQRRTNAGAHGGSVLIFVSFKAPGGHSRPPRTARTPRALQNGRGSEPPCGTEHREVPPASPPPKAPRARGPPCPGPPAPLRSPGPAPAPPRPSARAPRGVAAPDGPEGSGDGVRCR